MWEIWPGREADGVREFERPPLKREFHWDLGHEQKLPRWSGREVSRKVNTKVRWTYECPMQIPFLGRIHCPSHRQPRQSLQALLQLQTDASPKVTYLQANSDGPFQFPSTWHSWLRLPGLRHSLISASSQSCFRPSLPWVLISSTP